MDRKAAAAAAVILTLSIGLWGIRWGLPSAERLARVAPPGLNHTEFRQALAASWSAMHQELGENLMVNPKSMASFSGVVDVPSRWKSPPYELLNSYRSFYVRSEHEDEQSTLLALSRMKPRRLEFNTHLFTYGAPHIYAVGAALALGAAAGVVPLQTSILFYLEDPSRMAAMYLAGRLVTTAAFVGCALMLLRLGRRASGANTGAAGGLEAGAFAAAIFVLTPAAVVQAHVLKNHMFWAFFALWTLDRCFSVLERGTPKDYAAAGAVAGLATASFLGAWPACLLVGAAGAMRLAGLHAPKAEPEPPKQELAGLVLAGACAAAAFFAVNPYWLLDFREAMAEMSALRSLGGLDLTHPLLFVQNALRRSVTDSVLVLMFGGALFAVLKGKREPALLLCAIAFLLGLASMATVGGVVSTRQVRYFLGWAAAGSLLAGRLLQELRALKGAAGRIVMVAAAIMMAGLACHGLSYAYNFALSEGERSNHYRAGEWIEQNVPQGDVIGLLRYPQPSNSPYFRFDDYRLRFIEPAAAAGLPLAQSPRWLALTIPDYDDRPALAPLLSRYERAAVFPRARLLPWIELDPTSTTANPLIEIYRLKEKGA